MIWLDQFHQIKMISLNRIQLLIIKADGFIDHAGNSWKIVVAFSKNFQSGKFCRDIAGKSARQINRSQNLTYLNQSIDFIIDR